MRPKHLFWNVACMESWLLDCLVLLLSSCIVGNGCTGIALLEDRRVFLFLTLRRTFDVAKLSSFVMMMHSWFLEKLENNYKKAQNKNETKKVKIIAIIFHNFCSFLNAFVFIYDESTVLVILRELSLRTGRELCATLVVAVSSGSRAWTLICSYFCRHATWACHNGGHDGLRRGCEILVKLLVL